MPVINGEVNKRGRDLFFGYRRLHEGVDGKAIISGDWKLMRKAKNDGRLRLYNLAEDPYEQSDLVTEMPERVEALRQRLQELETSCQQSRDGADYRY